MLWLDRLVYHTVARVRWLYRLAAAGNACATSVVYGRPIKRVQSLATISGTIDGKAAVIRPIDVRDLAAASAMLASIPADHVRFFRPHGLDEGSVRRVLAARTIITYGLFLEDEMVAYCLLKLFVTRRAYLGRVVVPSLSGRGIGRFLNRFLYWQVYELGFQVYGTMHRDNLASAKSHMAVRPFTVIADLPPGIHGPGFRLIHFHVLESDGEAPELCLKLREPREPKSQAPQDQPPRSESQDHG